MANSNHDERGRFAAGSGGGAATGDHAAVSPSTKTRNVPGHGTVDRSTVVARHANTDSVGTRRLSAAPGTKGASAGPKVPNKLGTSEAQPGTEAGLMKCSAATTVTMPPRMPYESDLWIWSRYALTLEINRHVPDAFPDDLVSEHLQHVRANIPLLPFFEH